MIYSHYSSRLHLLISRTISFTAFLLSSSSASSFCMFNEYNVACTMKYCVSDTARLFSIFISSNRRVHRHNNESLNMYNIHCCGLFVCSINFNFSLARAFLYFKQLEERYNQSFKERERERRGWRGERER